MQQENMERKCIIKRRLLESAVKSSFRVGSLVKALGISQRQLQRYTQLIFGRSPQNWLNEQRLLLAAQKLKEQRLIKSVAIDLGYKRISHFSREFKRFHHLSPSAFVKMKAAQDQSVFSAWQGAQLTCVTSQVTAHTKSEMNPRLTQIQNWLELLQKAKWKVKTLAQVCGVSVRTLQRHFREHADRTPAEWLRENRYKKAVTLLSNGCSRKEAASEVGYRYPQHFSRAFKNYEGVNPPIETASIKPVADCRILV